MAFLWLDNRVIDEFAPAIGPSALAVYTALVRRGNRDATAIMRVSTIGKMVGLGQTAVRTAIDRLERTELISVYERFGDRGQQLSSEYWIREVPGTVRADWATREYSRKRIVIEGQRAVVVGPPESGGGPKRTADGVEIPAVAGPSESGGGPKDPSESGAPPSLQAVPPPPDSGGHINRYHLEKKPPEVEAVSLKKAWTVFAKVEGWLAGDADMTIEQLVAAGIVDVEQWRIVSASTEGSRLIARSRVRPSRWRVDYELIEQIDMG